MAGSSRTEQDWQAAAQRMVNEQLKARGILDPRVLDAMRRVPRHRFVNAAHSEHAYDDRPLPTALGQTVSQPYMVALMTELLDVKPGQRVLEIGTGSGYQAAILAELGGDVLTIERHACLVSTARTTLEALGYGDQVQCLAGDGTVGLPGQGPFDRILVTAGGPGIPPALVEQLVIGGRLVIPVGHRAEQQLRVVVREANGVHETASVRCRFVPLVGEAAWPEGDDG